MEKTTKYKFEANTWIKFVLDDLTCIGRTLIIEGKELVAILNSVGLSGILPFENIKNPSKLSFIKNSENDENTWNNIRAKMFFDKNFPGKEKQEGMELMNILPYLGKTKPLC